jgi:hypothetical protein
MKSGAVIHDLRCMCNSTFRAGWKPAALGGYGGSGGESGASKISFALSSWSAGTLTSTIGTSWRLWLANSCGMKTGISAARSSIATASAAGRLMQRRTVTHSTSMPGGLEGIKSGAAGSTNFSPLHSRQVVAPSSFSLPQPTQIFMVMERRVRVSVLECNVSRRRKWRIDWKGAGFQICGVADFNAGRSRTTLRSRRF